MKAILITILILAAFSPNANTRYDNAVVTDSYYDYGDDANITYLATSDGNEWAVYGTIVPEGTECVVKFDTKGNNNIYDDEIVSIVFDCKM